MPRTAPPTAWLVACAAAAGLAATSAAPGWLGAGAGAGVREAFSLVCHQLADRSPHVGGGQWALCHRCTGMVVGLAVGVLSGPVAQSAFARAASVVGAGRLLVLAGLPLALDWALGATGAWANTPASRFATGAVFGLVAGWLLAEALLRPTPTRSVSPHPLHPTT